MIVAHSDEGKQVRHEYLNGRPRGFLTANPGNPQLSVPLRLLLVFLGVASCRNSHVYYHVLLTDGEALFHPAIELDIDDFLSVQTKMRSRGLRWMRRHRHLDSTAVASLDSMDHAGGWSVDASVRIEEWNRQGLERLVRYCARPPISGERLAWLNDTTLVYSLRKPTLDGRRELTLTPIELLDRLSKLITPPRIHKHRYCGVFTAECETSAGGYCIGRTTRCHFAVVAGGAREDGIKGCWNTNKQRPL